MRDSVPRTGTMHGTETRATDSSSVTRQAPPGTSPWYKDAIIYELHVRTFYDSDGDGIGDFSGLTAKLDYLQNLGVTALWLLPFYPSPLRDDGYDIADYTDVHPDSGTLRDFKTFLAEAHRRGLRVIIELVLNHTSDAHQWFQRARHARRGSAARNFYVWSDTPHGFKDARVIFRDDVHAFTLRRSAAESERHGGAALRRRVARVASAGGAAARPADWRAA
jgi:1,4-alpha-glucan branching enzyme